MPQIIPYRGYSIEECPIKTTTPRPQNTSHRNLKIVHNGVDLKKRVRYLAFNGVSKARAVRKCEKFIDALIDK